MQINYDKLNTGNRFCLQNKTKRKYVLYKKQISCENSCLLNDSTIENYEISIERMCKREREGARQIEIDIE